MLLVHDSKWNIVGQNNLSQIYVYNKQAIIFQIMAGCLF